ncbi:MAG: hypothetical protein ABR507_09460 [Actinomycetota bacterium]|nr:hypothetical protein [Actinomycetota bacterium]
MTEERWPHIDEERLKELWGQYAPSFLKVDDVDRDLVLVRDAFLSWLWIKGIDLGPIRPARLGPRARIDSVRLTRRGPEAETEVNVSLRDMHAGARRIGSAIPEEITRLSAEATLEAMNTLLPVVGFALEQVFTIGSPSTDLAPIAIVVVREPSGRSPDRYVGACPINASVPEAAAKATMAAINRRAEYAAGLIDGGERNL